MPTTNRPQAVAPISSGIAALDEVLCGGWPGPYFFLVEGDPGSGKTTLGLQFLLDGRARGERTLYVTLSETESELRTVAASHGWTLDGLDIFELRPADEAIDVDDQYTIFHPSEVELGITTKALYAEADRVRPTRVVLDSLSEMRLLAREPLRFRRQILALKQFFSSRGCAVLLLDDRTAQGADVQLRTLAHGVLLLENMTPEYGSERRRLRVSKMRGVQFRGGYHDFSIGRGGLRVYPRLVAAEHPGPFQNEVVPSGVPALDELLGGGFDRGTSALLIGPAGVGKSSVAMQYAIEAAGRGETSALFIFDETLRTFYKRGEGLGLKVASASGLMTVRQVDPAELSPGGFVQTVRDAVERDHARIIVIDSLNGYLKAMRDEDSLLVQMHELLTFLGHQGVLTLIVVAQHGVLGSAMDSPIDVSYLADAVVLLRFFEAGGRVRQAISVVKKRSGAHERTIRELRFGPGVIVGEPLTQFQGVLSGAPIFAGTEAALGPDDRTS